MLVLSSSKAEEAHCQAKFAFNYTLPTPMVANRINLDPLNGLSKVIVKRVLAINSLVLNCKYLPNRLCIQGKKLKPSTPHSCHSIGQSTSHVRLHWPSFIHHYTSTCIISWGKTTQGSELSHTQKCTLPTHWIRCAHQLEWAPGRSIFALMQLLCPPAPPQKKWWLANIHSCLHLFICSCAYDY